MTSSPQAVADVLPIPMVLHCPECRARHIDVGEFATKVHHTHSCQACGLTWRPAVVPTVGVQFLPGFKNEAARSAGGGCDHVWVARSFVDLTKVCARCHVPKYAAPAPAATTAPVQLNAARLDELEQRAYMAESVELPVLDFLALTTAARNGLRPKLLSETHGPAQPGREPAFFGGVTDVGVTAAQDLCEHEWGELNNAGLRRCRLNSGCGSSKDEYSGKIFAPPTPPDAAQGKARDALEWALGEIDYLANRICQWAYPQAIPMIYDLEPDRIENVRTAYAIAIEAKSATPAAPPAQGVGYPTMDDIAKPMIDGGVAESHANWYASGYVAAYKLLNTRPSPQAAIRVGEAEIVHDLRIAATFCDFHDHNLLAGRIRTFADHLQSTGGAVK